MKKWKNARKTISTQNHSWVMSLNGELHASTSILSHKKNRFAR
jgi:hypothetical protein